MYSPYKTGKNKLTLMPSSMSYYGDMDKDKGENSNFEYFNQWMSYGDVL